MVKVNRVLIRGEGNMTRYLIMAAEIGPHEARGAAVFRENPRTFREAKALSTIEARTVAALSVAGDLELR